MNKVRLSEEYYNTLKWSCTVGVNSGYDLGEQKKMSMEEITSIYMNIANEVYKETNIYISAVVQESRVLYNSDWGCPSGGEYAYTFTGSCNPEFAEVDRYLAALKLVEEELKIRLKQSTILMEFTPAHLDYLTE